jgi:hypothetical protein
MKNQNHPAYALAFRILYGADTEHEVCSFERLFAVDGKDAGRDWPCIFVHLNFFILQFPGSLVPGPDPGLIEISSPKENGVLSKHGTHHQRWGSQGFGRCRSQQSNRSAPGLGRPTPPLLTPVALWSASILLRTDKNW